MAGVDPFLSDDWLRAVQAAAEALPAVPGCSVRARLEVVGGPGGPCRLGVVISDGRLAELSPGRLSDPDCTVSCNAADAGAILRGELDAAVAYMQGRLKVDGSYERVLFGLRPILASELFRAVAAEVRSLSGDG